MMKYHLYILILLIFSLAAKSDSKYYTEKYRPQFHFSPEKHWLFEPAGFLFSDGEYHLFYQNIFLEGKVATNQIGHATSKDLVHWQHLPFAFTPDEKATTAVDCQPATGTAFMDSLNVSGLGSSGSKPMLVYFSDSKGNQHLAYSNDKGLTWKKYAGNPILRLNGESAQDPFVFRHSASGKFVMALYRNPGGQNGASGISVFNSTDLLNWQLVSHLDGFRECPEIFEVPFGDKGNEKKWVALSGEGDYCIGDFDGKTFKAEGGMRKLDLGQNFYAARTLTNAPNGKVIQVAWMRGGEYPEMPFNGQMSFPVELTLRNTKDGIILCREPIREISRIYDKEVIKKQKNLIPGIDQNLLSGIKGEMVYIQVTLKPGNSDSFGIVVRNGKTTNGTDIRYDTAKKMLEINGIKMPLEPIDGRVILKILVDKSSIELFANNGEKGISTCFAPAKGEEEYILYTQGGELMVESLEAHTLKTAWQKK